MASSSMEVQAFADSFKTTSTTDLYVSEANANSASVVPDASLRCTSPLEFGIAAREGLLQGHVLLTAERMAERMAERAERG